MDNLVNLSNFKKQKIGDKLITEMVQEIGDNYIVTTQIAVPKTLVRNYVRKVKDATQDDIAIKHGEYQIAESLVNWTNTNLLNVDNLPANIMTGQVTPPQAQQQQAQQVQPVQTAEEVPAQQVDVPVQAQQAQQAQQGQQVQQQVQSTQGQGEI